MEKADVVWVLLVNEALRLHNVGFFVEWCVKECGVDVDGLYLVVVGIGEGKKQL
jgi:hypothetical protein